MCSACDYGIDQYRERGAYRIEDEDEVRHRPKAKKRGKRFKGCPANEKKAHIYVWVKYIGKRRAYVWTEQGLTWGHKDGEWYKRLCIGCGHVNTTRYTFWGGWEPPEIYEVRDGDVCDLW